MTTSQQRQLERWLLLVALSFASGCSNAERTQGTLDKVRIAERGTEAGGDFCRDFDMTPAQVTAFFKRAQLVDAARLHDKFDHLPCYIRGTAVREGEAATWEIRAGGTGKITVKKTAVTLLYGCSACDDLFGQTKK